MMKFKFIVLFALSTIMIASSNHAFSQRTQNKSLGNLISHSIDDQTLNLTTSYGNVAITVYDKGIFRLRIVQDKFVENFSYSVVGIPIETDFRFREESSYLFVETDLLTLQISKNPVRFVFYSADGTILNEDDPAFGTSWIGNEVTTYKTLHEDERFLGLGEKTGNLDKRGNAYDNWNTDNPRYGPQDDPLYVTIPFYIGVLKGKSYGIFMDNTHRSKFNFGASNNRFSSFSADDGEMDYYFFHDINVSNILKQYTYITGRMQMPPLWSLGYQQCRWSYFPDTEVLNIAENFRERQIPLDVLYLDIHFMDAYKIFTWHPIRFKDPAGLVSSLKSMGIHTAIIVDPGIKVEKGYEAYEEGLEKDMFAKFPDGQVYTAQVWPGWCHFPDFTKPSAREWWGDKFSNIAKIGIDGFWNDMNEIASWGGGNTPHLVNFDWEGETTTYKQAKNVYGMLMARSTFEGAKKHMLNKRPFILTRAGFAGLQRYSALWTGDNQSTDEHLLLGARLINSLGISGVSFAGMDVGGFSQNATPALFARWVSLGAFTPFFRSHTHYDTRQSEPWSYGESVENISRNYIQLRYKLLPYLYSAFKQSTTDGIPVARSLAIDYTFDEKIYSSNYQNQFLFGPYFLIAPVESTKELAKVYLPEGKWYNFHTDSLHEGNSEIIVECPLSKLPIFIKAGAIIPIQIAIQSTSQSVGDTLFMHIYKGEELSSFIYYEDDGLTYNYKQDVFFERNITFDPKRNEIKLDNASGKLVSKFKYIEFVMHGFTDNTFYINGSTLALKEKNINLLNALEENNPNFLEDLHTSIKVKTFVTKHDKEKLLITWK